MNSDIDNRTNRRGAPNPRGKPAHAAGETSDLEKLDAEANADIEHRSRPRAIFIGVGPSEPVGNRRTYAAAPGVMPVKTVFRRMLDSFFGLDVRR